MRVSKCDQAFNEGVVLPNLLRSKKWDPREAKDILGLWIFPCVGLLHFYMKGLLRTV